MAKRYILMHKNIPVADIVIDSASGSISAVNQTYMESHVPVGIPVIKGKLNRAAINEWWKGRAIPASRDGIKNALMDLNISTTQQLLEKSLGLSLSDQYWICPADSGVKWSHVNFFDNPFSYDVGNVLFGKGSSGDEISLISPDNTSDGWLKKKWQIIDGRRCLIKGGIGAIQQEPYNEVLASRIMERLGIPHVSYTPMVQDDYPYSVCEDFITPQTELITAWYIMQTRQKPNHVSLYQHYLNSCELLGIPSVVDSLDRMMVLDYIIANEDRHQNNFGVIRNAETLEWGGPAPIYDSGSSLWFASPQALIGSTRKLTCKPFKNDHNEQIKLVTSFDWLDLSLLKGIDEEFREILRGSIFIDETRCDALCFALRKRVEMLASLVIKPAHMYRGEDLRFDVEKNVEYSKDQYKEEEWER
ncbi:MAG: excisionase [Desulfosporosinus sp.]|nr:excisionase [Desulfosporosinus sp.]